MSAIASQVVDLDEYRDLRLIVESNIRSFVKKGTMQARIVMMTTVAGVMKKYRRRRMRFGNYDVSLVRIDGKDFPIIRARRKAESCPQCGRQHGLLYIRTQRQNLLGPRDLVTWGCMECGEIFARWELNERGGDDRGA